MFKKNIAVLTVFLLTVFYSGSVSAEDKLVDELMEKSGLNLAIEQMPDQIGQGFVVGLSKMEDVGKGEIEKINKLMRKSFSNDILKKTMNKYISENLKKADIKKTIEWLDSPLGKKITDLENKSQTAEAEQYLMENMEYILSKTDKLERAKKFDKAIKMTDKIVDMMQNIQKTMMVAMMSYAPEGQKMTTAQIERMVEKSREEERAAMETIVHASIVSTYQTLSDKEFNQYIEFNESPSGSRYNNVTLKAFGIAFEEALKKFAGLIGSKNI